VSATLPGDRPVDIELLADFSEGLLPPDEASAVQARVDADPEWADTLALLRASGPAVASALASYAEATDDPMPTDISDRLAAALIAERAPAAPRLSDQRPPRSSAATGPPASRKPPGRRRSRHTAWSRGALVAVAVLVVAGLGLFAKFGISPEATSNSKTTAASGSDAAAPALPGLMITASGTNYTSLLTPFAASATPTNPLIVPHATRSPAGINGPALGSPSTLEHVQPVLDRLLNPATLRACLTKIEGLAGGTAQSVDFATYEGTPAIVVVLDSPSSAIAADSNCDLLSPVTTPHS